MAKNDAILLDALIDQRLAAGDGKDRGEAFEYFVLEQVLKSYELSSDDILFGWTDGQLDGGVDGFYTFVNGHLVTDAKTHQWPRSNVELDVFIITSKHHETFQQAVLDALLATFQELFDLSKSNAQLSGTYSGRILRARDAFVAAFRQVAILNPTLRFRVIYASRGDTHKLGESIAARGKQVETLLRQYFSASSSEFQALGAAELVEINRQVKTFALSLPFLEHLTADQDGYVVLARLKDYCAFVTDEKGALRRYLFDSNVRDFLGANVINAGITTTLRDSGSPNFWWLNNGVTILSTNATVVGKQLQLRDIQIVNGLQTTESLYRHFVSEGRSENGEKPVLIKVIVSQDEGVRDQVIRATNSQSTVEPSALHATDKIQRDLESILESRDWYYERRTNYFRNAGKPQARIVTPHFMGSGVVALVLKNPTKAAKFKQRNLRAAEAYDTVFASYYPIDLWPAIADQLKRAEQELSQLEVPNWGARIRLLSVWRGLLAFLAVSCHFGTFDYDIGELSALRPSSIPDGTFEKCYELLKPWVELRQGKLKAEDVDAICRRAGSELDIRGNARLLRRNLPGGFLPNGVSSKDLTDELLESVDRALPPQPWKPRVHVVVAESLGISANLVTAAITRLIASGRRYEQVDGCVYDKDGTVIMVDEGRIAS